MKAWKIEVKQKHPVFYNNIITFQEFLIWRKVQKNILNTGSSFRECKRNSNGMLRSLVRKYIDLYDKFLISKGNTKSIVALCNSSTSAQVFQNSNKIIICLDSLISVENIMLDTEGEIKNSLNLCYHISYTLNWTSKIKQKDVLWWYIWA